MIPVKFDPKELTGPLKAEWDAWQAKADAATDRIIAAWETWRQSGSPGEFKVEFEETIWGELKEWLLKNVFHDKCAYCETRETRAPYHAEHFRPKGLITIKIDGKKRQQTGTAVDENGNTIKHPGYFWLAYNWVNLLPSCNYCNTAQGKKNQFPVGKTHLAVTRLTQEQVVALRQRLIQSKTRNDIYYLQPEDLDAFEDRLLLHPYLDNPLDHLVFGEFGVVTAREGSEKGKHSIKVYNLDAGSLEAERQKAQDDALDDYSSEIGRGKRISKADRIKAAKAMITGYIEGNEPYSAAVMAHLREFYSDHAL